MTYTEEQSLQMRARTPEDILAIVPVVLGFAPEESVTMLSTGYQRMHARVDLPESPEHQREVARALLQPCRRHGITKVALVFHAVDAEPAGSCARLICNAFADADIEVAQALRADGQRWFALDPDNGRQAVGVAYDISAHPFIAQAVLRGEVVFTSRQAMAESLDPDPARVKAVSRLLPGVPPHPPDSEPAWVSRLMAGCLAEDRPPSDAEVARLLAALPQPAVRDTVWQVLNLTQAAAQVRFLSHVLVASPPQLRSRPAALVAFAAWLAGNGALAWCALDRIDPGTEDHVIANMTRQLLEHAIPPSAWERTARFADPAPR